MQNPDELREAAARCRRLANSLGNPDDAGTLAVLATELDAEAVTVETAEADEAARARQQQD